MAALAFSKTDSLAYRILGSGKGSHRRPFYKRLAQDCMLADIALSVKSRDLYWWDILQSLWNLCYLPKRVKPKVCTRLKRKCINRKTIDRQTITTFNTILNVKECSNVKLPQEKQVYITHAWYTGSYKYGGIRGHIKSYQSRHQHYSSLI